MDIENLKENNIKLIFPFTIDGKTRSSVIETIVEHSQGIICFSLVYSLSLTIQNANLLSKEHKGNTFVYIYEFNSLNEAKEWINNKEAHVEQCSKTEDVYTIQKELNAFMKAYEDNERLKTKKTKVIDEDGFSYYN